MALFRPQAFAATVLADLGGLLLIVGVFVPYYQSGEGSGSQSLWDSYARVDWLYIVLGAAAMLLAAAALFTASRATFAAVWSVGLFALGLVMLIPIESAFDWGDFTTGFYLTAIGPILVVFGGGLGLAASRPDG